MLWGDKPIVSDAEDILGFGPFADALAKSLSEMAPEEGIVISIEGEWGSGKTSAIELIYRRLVVREIARERVTSIDDVSLEKWSAIESSWMGLRDTRRMHIIRFNPWNFSGQDNLVHAFFKEIGVAIGQQSDGRVALAIKRITSLLPSALSVAGASAASVFLGFPAGSMGATVGKAIGEVGQGIFDSSTSLETAKGELADALRSAGKRVVVIIDDLDRLIPTEMRAMFSLVKSLGDLPNVLYVLSFDRDVVARSITSGAEQVDQEFLQKIIQVQLKLPPPWQSEVRSLFFKRIDEVIGDVSPNDQSRWQHVFLDAIAPYIRTPRDVTRFRNTLQVFWPNVAGDVDLTDLVTLIVLQLFEPNVFQLIFENVESLSGDDFSMEDDKSFAERFEPTNTSNPKAAKKALGHLFPRLAKGWTGNSMDGVPYIKKREQRRLCTREYYRNYFLFGRDPDRLSRVQIEASLSSKRPFEAISAILVQLNSGKIDGRKSKTAAFLDQLFETVHAKPLLSNEVVLALLDLSDDLIRQEDRVWELFVEDNLGRLESVVCFGLDPLDREKRDERFKVLVEHNGGLTLAAQCAFRLAGHHGMYGNEARFENEQLVSRETAVAGCEKIAARIRSAATAGALFNHPRPLRLLFIWRWINGVDEVKNWLDKQIEDDAFVLKLAKLLPNISYRSSANGRHEIRSFKSTTYSEILNIDHFRERLNSIADCDGEDSEARLIQLEFLAAEAIGNDSRY